MRELFIPAVIQPELCLACGRCYRACPNHAIYFIGSTRNIDYKKCKGCLSCVLVCGQNAITVTSVYREGVFGISINHGKCKGENCGVCIETCPKHLYYLDTGERPAQKLKIRTDDARLAECQGCHACEEICPEHAIKLLEYKVPPNET
jgi:electron transport complex protein RnfB